MRRALITGISGQDGSYLTELLLEKGYEVHGVVRRVAAQNPEVRFERIEHLLDRIHLHPASLESYASVAKVVQTVEPHECYHLAGQSFVSYSFEDEFATIQTNIASTHFVLAAVKEYAPIVGSTLPGRLKYSVERRRFRKVKLRAFTRDLLTVSAKPPDLN